MGEKQPGVKTVRYSTLVNGHNVVDQVFASYVRAWMRECMPGMPLDLLDIEDVEKWVIEPRDRFQTVEVEYTVWRCPECEEEHTEVTECCVESEKEDAVAYFALVESTATAYAVIDTDAARPWYSDGFRGLRPDMTVTVDDVADVSIWIEESEADDVAARANQELDQESSYGFPWANSWFFMPDSWVTTAVLKAAGFVVATYKDEHRLCGIDGGGYSMFEAHHCKLVALHAEDRTITVKTAQGDVYVTMDERSDLEILAEDGSKGWAKDEVNS